MAGSEKKSGERGQITHRTKESNLKSSQQLKVNNLINERKTIILSAMIQILIDLMIFIVVMKFIAFMQFIE